MKIQTFICSLILATVVVTAIAMRKAGAQLMDVKPWHGYYPEMKGSYPLSFIAFKGFLFPVPYLFIRTIPTHYYVEAGSLPVSDGTEYTGQTKTGFLRIAAKLMERSQMEGRYEETHQIKNNTEFQKQISQKLFDARKDELPDIFGLADRLVALYKKINSLDQLEYASAAKHILQDEADDLLTRFLMINLFESDHGAKLEAFSEIRSRITKLTGETDYTFRKLYHLNVFGEGTTSSYAFIIR
jgi:hypothetical protein